MGNTSMSMPAKPWSKAQATNNKKLKAKLDRLTIYLVEGDWHSSYNSATYADSDSFTSFFIGKDILPLETLSFTRLQDGSLELRHQYVQGDDSIDAKPRLLAFSLFRTLFMLSALTTTTLGLGRLAGDLEC
jgi:hypothetical protein